MNKTIVILRNLSGDEKVRQEAYYREKRLHDEATALGHARREGLAEGLSKGRAEGIAKGRLEAKRELAQKMREKGMTEDAIREILDEE